MAHKKNINEEISELQVGNATQLICSGCQTTKSPLLLRIFGSLTGTFLETQCTDCGIILYTKIGGTTSIEEVTPTKSNKKEVSYLG